MVSARIIAVDVLKEKGMATILLRRHFLAAVGGASVGSALRPPATAQAQSSSSLRLSAREAGNYHRKSLTEAINLHGKNELFSLEDFSALIDDLVQKKVIPPDYSTYLKELIEMLLKSQDIDKLAEQIAQEYRKLKDYVGDLVLAIVSIMLDSIEYAREWIGNQDPKKVILVVAHDVKGALLGASAGVGVGAAFLGIGAVPAAVIGAVLGAGSTSVIAALEEKT